MADDKLVPDAAAELHAKFLETMAAEFNKADEAQRRRMQANLNVAKARSISSVGGLRSLFPGLGKLRVTKAGRNEP